MRLSIASLVVLAALSSGCEDIEECGTVGETQACTCTDGRSGAQECLPEGVWDDCVCTGPFGDAGEPAVPSMSGGDGDGDATPGVPTAGDGDGDGDGDAAGGGDGDGDGDGDVMGDGDGGVSGDGDVMGDGDAMGDGDGDAAGDGDATPVDAYANCTMQTDCPVADSVCVANIPAPFTSANICAPPCTDANDCPIPEGSYEASVECNLGRCMLNCTTVDLITQRSCPTGTACQLTGFSSTCFAE